MRNGIGNAIDIPLSGPRATVPVSVKVNGTEEVPKTFQIVGPADVIGFNRDLVIRTEPLHFNTNFPPNYLAHIEFYDEDLPWRYTPAKATTEKLNPWISLIVLEESEFDRTDILVPLPQITVKQTAPLPLNNETWLWAHVQTIVASSQPKDIAQPDHIISRLICPRKLEPNKAYYAFVIPSYETGRLAGLGESEDKIKDVDSQAPAWDGTKAQTTFPVYYEWYFHTGNQLDFEYLASLLKPSVCNEWVGRKMLDCTHPGFGIYPYNQPFNLYFEGALKSPQPITGSAAIEINQTDLTSFGEQLKTTLALASLPNGDPVVAPPFYGQKHIFEKTLELESDDKWIHELNRDPRWRVPAGFGGEIIRRYQDHYLQKAWEQVESIIEANKVIAAAVNTLSISKSLFKNHFDLPDHELTSITAPVHGKLLREVGQKKYSTLSQLYKESCFNGSVYGTAFRRLLRKRGVFRKKLDNDIDKLNFSLLEVLIIDNATRNYSILTVDKNQQFKIKTIAIEKAEFEYFKEATDPVNLSLSLRGKIETDDDGQILNTFKSILAEDYNTSLEQFKNIVKKTYDSAACGATPISDFTAPELNPLNPIHTIRALLTKMLKMPEDTWFNEPEKIKPALAYPDFEDPMWEKLNELSTEWLVPNLQLLPNNTITLLQSNQKFIESFMVGLNVAMNSEMCWREYPTDERGSCFRQFWDVKGIRDLNGTTTDAAKAAKVEEFKDITPIDTWKNWEDLTNPHGQKLGSHNKRPPVTPLTTGDDHVVLALRGDLFKNFPNLSVYAAKADVDGLRIATPDPENIKFPIFKADIGADVKLLGFDLSKLTALGDGTPSNSGWFFVLQETPGETRFGLDINGTDTPGTWDAISWPLLGQNPFINNNQVNTAITDLNTTETKWGRSSSDMADILFQKPVMIVIHAKELLKNEPVVQ